MNGYLEYNETNNYSPSTNVAGGLTYSVNNNIGLLPGSSINSSTGQLTIVSPSTPTTVILIITATNESGSSTTNFTVNVKNPEITGFIYNPSSLNVLTYSNTYTFTPSTTTGANISYSIAGGNSLPNGLSLNTSSGIITGNPTSSFISPTNIIASSNGVQSKSASINFNIKVNISTINVSYLIEQNPIVNRGGGYNVSVSIGFFSGSFGSISNNKFNNTTIFSLISGSGTTTNSPNFTNWYTQLRVSGNVTSNPNWTFFTVIGNNGVSKTFHRVNSTFSDYDPYYNTTFFNFDGKLSDSWTAYYPDVYLNGITSLSVNIE